ncbi:MAG TPA: two-component regulator propeller domain-containing protein, partial [Desulfuromonadaceae bacterium]|nr:two-component regulator propeller domain-containing protein [Desulfuromonadaceae bacterium]
MAIASANSSWYTRVWRSEDGLPNDSVTALAQTPDGYLWTATPTHLARFDGNEFEESSQASFAPGNNQRITTAVCGRDGCLWLPMDRGPVIRLKDGVVEVISNGFPNLVVEDAMEDGDGVFWISYRGGSLCRIKDGRAYTVSEKDGYPGPRGGGCTLALDNQGRCWCVQRGQVFRYHDGRFSSVFQFSSSFTRMTTARNGGFWICSGAEFFKYDERTGAKMIGRLTTDAGGAVPTTLLETRDGAVWIGTATSGLFRYDASGFENISTSHSDILSLLEDREGNLWVGTAGGGLDRVQRRVIELENSESGLPADSVRSLCEDIDGTLWAVTQNDLLAHRVNNFWTTVSTAANWRGGPVVNVASDPRGGVWIGGRSRLYHWKDGEVQTWDAGLANHIIRALLADTNGNVWIGGEKLERFRDGVSTPIPMPREVETIRALAMDAAGNVWAVSVNGFLLRISGDRAYDETTRVFGRPLSARCLTATPDGSLWIGFANDGVGLLKDGKFFKLGTAQGLMDGSISQILPDDSGWMWFGADHGIFKVPRKELENAMTETNRRIQCIHYGRDEGSPGLQANYGASPAFVRGRDGRLWFSLRTGVAVIDPARLHDDLNPPPVLLKRVSADDRAVASYGGPMPVND